MADQKMMLYICPNCEILLLAIDTKRTYYTSNELDEDGWYEGHHSSDDEHDEYTCAACSTMEYSKNENGDVLKSITFNTTKTAKMLLELWQKVKDENDSLCNYGISLHREELKAIIMEDSIGGDE